MHSAQIPAHREIQPFQPVIRPFHLVIQISHPFVRTRQWLMRRFSGRR
jgi:hypothetical protein